MTSAVALATHQNKPAVAPPDEVPAYRQQDPTMLVRLFQCLTPSPLQTAITVSTEGE